MAARGGGPPRAPMPIFGWSDRNFRCIIYSRFNEPRKRSKGPRGLFLIIRRTREGRDSRSPFPPLLLSLSPFPSSELPMLHGFLSFFDSFATSSSIDDTLLPGCWVQFFSSRVSFHLLFAGRGIREARRLICLIRIARRNVSRTKQRFND